MNLLLSLVVLLLCVQIGLFVVMIRLIMVHKRILVPLAQFDRMISDLDRRWRKEKAIFMRKMMEEDWRKDMLYKK